MSERKGKDGLSLKSSHVADICVSVEQVLPPGLRPVLDPSKEGSKELPAGRSSYGSILHVSIYFSVP
jgi:hypothetical protein